MYHPIFKLIHPFQMHLGLMRQFKHEMVFT